MLRSPRASNSADNASPTPPLSAKISQLARLAGAEGLPVATGGGNLLRMLSCREPRADSASREFNEYTLKQQPRHGKDDYHGDAHVRQPFYYPQNRFSGHLRTFNWHSLGTLN